MRDRQSGGFEGGASDCSRRSFLKGGGAFLGAAFLAGSGIGVAGCASEDNANGNRFAANGDVIEYAVFDTDLLVIGGGLAGMSAAFEAQQLGAEVMLVDKAPYSFSGGAGMNWDQEVAWIDTPYPDYQHTGWNDALENQKYVKNVFDFTGNNIEALDLRMHYVRNGGTTWSRKEDGTWENLMLTGTGMNMIQGGFSRHMADQLKGTGLRIIDNTMITNLLVQEGKCFGALGYDIHSGEYRVFRAKAVVALAGGTCQMYGWVRTHPHSMNTPDNTGELDAAAYRNGCTLVGAEFFAVDLISVEPASLGCSFNSGIGADGNHMKFVCDKDGDFLMRNFVGYDISRPVREAVIAGKGGEHGGLFIDLTGDDSVTRHALRPIYARNIELWKEQFDIDVREAGHKIPVALEAFEHGIGPLTDENGMTQIGGLFSTRGCGRQRGDTTQFITAPFVTKKACEYMRGVKEEEIDWKLAEGEFSKLEDLRSQSGKGMRPAAIRHAIQETFYSAWEPCTDAGKLQGCLEELERIKQEEIPNMNMADKSKVYNLDWRTAIENENIMIATEATVRAALMREESRMTLFRSDFPEQDDENWYALVGAKLQDGSMSTERIEIAQAG